MLIVNASNTPKLEFSLPGMSSPEVYMEARNGKVVNSLGNLDTLIVDTNDMVVTLYYRCVFPLSTGAHDISQVAVKIAGLTKTSRPRLVA